MRNLEICPRNASGKIFPKTCLLIPNILFASLFVFFVLFSKAEEKANKHFRLGLKITGIASPEFTASGFPESARTIPHHPEDEWVKDLYYANNVLRDATIQVKPGFTTYCNAFMSLTDIIDLGFSFIIPGTADSNNRGRISQNQYGGSERGPGTSLRYYEMARSSFGCGLYSSLATPLIVVFKKDGYSYGFRPYISGVYQLINSNIRTQAGWDRYNQDEKWQKKKVGTVNQSYWDYGIEFRIGYPETPPYASFLENHTKLSFYIGQGQTYINHSGPVTYQVLNKRSSLMIGFGLSFQLGKSNL